MIALLYSFPSLGKSIHLAGNKEFAKANSRAERVLPQVDKINTLLTSYPTKKAVCNSSLSFGQS
jgi:hypothetical protein